MQGLKTVIVEFSERHPQTQGAYCPMEDSLFGNVGSAFPRFVGVIVTRAVITKKTANHKNLHFILARSEDKSTKL